MSRAAHLGAHAGQLGHARSSCQCRSERRPAGGGADGHTDPPPALSRAVTLASSAVAGRTLRMGWSRQTCATGHSVGGGLSAAGGQLRDGVPVAGGPARAAVPLPGGQRRLWIPSGSHRYSSRPRPVVAALGGASTAGRRLGQERDQVPAGSVATTALDHDGRSPRSDDDRDVEPELASPRPGRPAQPPAAAVEHTLPLRRWVRTSRAAAARTCSRGMPPAACPG